MKQFVFFLILSHYCIGYSQDIELPQIMGPSPSVAALQKFGDCQVSNYTGVPEINIPLYTINLKDITVPISISYNASGIKVTEEASRIGLGWVLHAGGNISRDIKGLDDLLSSSFGPNSFDLLGYPSKFSIATVNLPFGGYSYSIADKLGGTGVDPTNIGVKVDLEPDLFYCNFLGNSGKFILKKKDTSALFEDPSINMKIKLIKSETGSNYKILATGSDGTIYNFDEFEICSTFGPTTVPDRVTAWYLTKITTVRGTIVSFKYLQNNSGITSTLNQTSAYVNAPYGGSDAITPKVNIIPHHSYSNLILNSIEFPGGTVNFNYADRLDIQGDKRFTSMVVSTSAGEIVKNINFVQDYFKANSDGKNTIDLKQSLWGGMALDSNWITKRLKLVELKEISNDSINSLSHKFTYNENLLPLKNSTSKDHWGYFNNATNVNNLIPTLNWAYPGLIRKSAPPEYKCQVNTGVNDFSNSNYLFDEVPNLTCVSYQGANREVDSNYSQAFLLNKIIYPTGGSTKFTFEQNTYDKKKSFVEDKNAAMYDYSSGSQRLAFMTGVSNIPANTLKAENFSITPSDMLPGETKALVKFKFCAQSSSLQKSANNINTKVSLKKADGTILYSTSFNTLTGFPKENSNIYYFNFYDQRLDVGDYKIEIVLGGNDADKSSTFYYVMRSWNKLTDAGTPGINYKYCGGMRIRSIANYYADGALATCKNYNYHYKAIGSSGTLEQYSTGKLMGRPNYFDIQFGGAVKSYLKSESNCIGNIGYDSVIIEQNNNKYSEAFYNNAYRAIVYPIYYTAAGIEMMPCGTLGLPAIHIEGMGLPNNELTLNVGFDYKPEGQRNFYDNGNGKLIKSTNYLYDPISNKYTIASETEMQYNNVGNGINNIVWADKLKLGGGYEFLGPDGSIIGQCFKGLPPMYGVWNCFYPALRSVPVQIAQTKSTSYSANNKFIKTTNYEYNTLNLLQKKIQYNSNGDTLMSYYTYPMDYTSVKDGWLQKLKDLNMAAVPIEKRQLNGVLTTYSAFTQYDTLNKIIAPSKLFQIETGKPEFVNPTEPSAILASNFFAKAQLLYDKFGNLQELQRVNDLNETYLWGYNSQYPVAKIVGSDYATVSSKVTQSLLDNPTNEQVLRDELNKLRNIPNALVTVFTYRPLIGVTSETDPNGKTTYYEYDGFGRLQYIKDENKNIIKQFCYSYNGQQTECK